MATGLELSLRQTVSVTLAIVHEHPISALIRIWETAPHHVLKVGESDQIEFVICDPKYLHAVDDEEHYGIYLGHMTFVSTATPERWIPLVALHEWAERRIGNTYGQDEDPSGLAKHWQALYGEIRTAQLVLSEQEFHLYMDWRHRVERTQYFDIDEDVRRYFEERRTVQRALPGPVSQWRHRSMQMSGALSVIGYGVARDLGASHSDLLLAELRESSIELGDVYAVLARFVFVGIGVQVAVPRELAPAVFLLEAQVHRSVLVSVDGPGGSVLVRHKNGRTRQTVEALMRRLSEAQQRVLAALEQKALPASPVPRNAGDQPVVHTSETDAASQSASVEFTTHPPEESMGAAPTVDHATDLPAVLRAALKRRLVDRVTDAELDALVNEAVLRRFTAEALEEQQIALQIAQKGREMDELQARLRALKDEKALLEKTRDALPGKSRLDGLAERMLVLVEATRALEGFMDDPVG